MITGIKIPGTEIEFSHDQLTGHIIIIGGTGGGKTSILRSAMKDIIKSEEKLFLADSKGDFSRQIPNAILASPFIKEGWVWTICDDIRCSADVETLISSFVQVDEKEPLWGNAARIVAEASMNHLRESSKNWSLEDFFKVMTDFNLVKSFLARDEPIFNEVFQAEKTVASILTNLATAMKDLKKLAEYQKTLRVLKRPEFSIRRWQKTKRSHPLIVGFDDKHKSASMALGNSLFTIAASNMLSHNFAETINRTHFVLDEFTKLGKLSKLMDLADLGRSKGACIYLSTQGLGKVAKTYSKEEMEDLLGNINNHFYLRLQNGPTAKYLSDNMSKNHYERLQVSVSSNESTNNSRTVSWQSHYEDVLPVSVLSNLKAGKNIVEYGLNMATNSNLYIISYKNPVRKIYKNESCLSEISPTKFDLIKRSHGTERADSNDSNQISVSDMAKIFVPKVIKDD